MKLVLVAYPTANLTKVENHTLADLLSILPSSAAKHFTIYDPVGLGKDITMIRKLLATTKPTSSLNVLCLPPPPNRNYNQAHSANLPPPAAHCLKATQNRLPVSPSPKGASEMAKIKSDPHPVTHPRCPLHEILNALNRQQWTQLYRHSDRLRAIEEQEEIRPEEEATELLEEPTA